MIHSPAQTARTEQHDRPGMIDPDASAPTHPTPASHRHTWSLAIATYNRRDVLLQCIKLAVDQSRPPAEVVVVDASKDWDATREQVLGELAPQYPAVRWVYEQARRPSAAVQRNQAAELSEADVVFLFDDDSFMLPGCAEAIMAVYDADLSGEVAGVAAKLAAHPPAKAVDEKAKQEIEAARVAPTVKQYSPLTKLARSLLDADNLFVPYDDDFPSYEVPEAIKALHVGRRPLMAGMTMTCRRALVVAERFSEILADRGPEDSDLSYRLSRRGMLLTALDAEVFHVGSPSGRFSSFSREALCNIGPLVLHRFYATDQDRSRKQSRRLLWRRSIIGLLKDLKAKELDLPRFKGGRFALRQLNQVFSMSREEIEAWYPDFQKQVMAGDALRGKKK